MVEKIVIKDITIIQNGHSYFCDKSGINFQPGKFPGWVATYAKGETYRTKPKRKTFMVAKFGFRGAFKKALAKRLQWEERYDDYPCLTKKEITDAMIRLGIPTMAEWDKSKYRKILPKSDFQPDSEFITCAVNEYINSGGTVTKIVMEWEHERG